MSFSDKVRNPSFRDRLIKAGAIQTALQQDLIRQNLNQRLALLAKAFFSSLDGKFALASAKDVTDSLKTDLTQQATLALGLTSSRVTLHYFRYKVMPTQLGELDTIVTARGFRRIGGIMDVISVHQFPKSKQSPNSKLCLAIEVNRKRTDPTITLAGVGFMGKKPADFAAASDFLQHQSGETRFGDLLAHKHLTSFTQLPGVAIELIDTPLQAIWEAVAQSGKR
ncbi:MAG: hypothetical protein WC405_21160 [Syntrophales bacterium]